MARNRFLNGIDPSQRQLRVGELIRRTLADVLARGEVHDPELNRISITVGEVRASPNLRLATAYVLPLGGREREMTLELLERNRSELRRIVGKRIGLRFVPDLRFRIDDTFDRLENAQRIFAQKEVVRDIDGRES